MMSASEAVYAAYSFALPIPGTALLRITGELDACSAELIEQQVKQTLAASYDRLVLDLSELEFVDSTGIRLLVHVISQRQRPGDVIVLSPRALNARRALEIVGFTRVTRSAPSLEEALSSPSHSAQEETARAGVG